MTDETEEAEPLIEWDRTDLGNTQWFAREHMGGIIFDHLKQRWLIWQEHRWRPDTGPLLKQKVMAFVQARYVEAMTAEIALEPSQRRATKHWSQANSERGMLAIEHLAKSIPGIADESGMGWDETPYLLGVPNGVVDLRTGELRDGKPEDRITKQARVPYDPTAKAPRWEKFLCEIHPDDKDGKAIREYLHRCYGYSATGESREHLLMLLVGVGRNGKSVERNAIFYVLGDDYTWVLPFQSLQLVRTTAERQTNDLAPLFRKRMAINSEANKGVKLDTARIKNLTGEDPVAVRFHFQEFFPMTNAATLWVAVNHKPEVPDDSDGMWERVRAVTYPNKYEKDAPGTDETLKERFQTEEAMGILAWVVRGSVRFYAEGLGAIPRGVRIATAQYRAQNDPIGEFVADRCIAEPGASESTLALHGAMVIYCEQQGIDMRLTPKRSALVDYLQMRGHDEKKRNKGRVFIGIRLLTAEELKEREHDHAEEETLATTNEPTPFWETD